MVYITSHISGNHKTWFVKKLGETQNCNAAVTYEDILETLYEKEGTCNNVSLTCEGRLVDPNDTFVKNVNIVATLQLRGGKGGFGSMLRAIGAQIEKTTNREACRDLSGRRLRDINEEKRLKDFLAKKVEKEKERMEIKRKKLEQLKEEPKHTFEDKTYFEQREKRERDIHDSLDKAFASGSEIETETSKVVVAETSSRKKNNKRRVLDDLDDSSDDSSNEDSEESVGDNAVTEPDDGTHSVTGSADDTNTHSLKEPIDDTTTQSVTETVDGTNPRSKSKEENLKDAINDPDFNEHAGSKRENGNSHIDEHINKKLKT